MSQKESEAKERKIGLEKREEIGNERNEYYEAHMKEETERLNKLVDWYEFKLNEIREAPVDSRPRKLEKLYRYSEANKNSGVTITRAGTINLVNYPGYPPELDLHEYKDGPAGPGVAARPHNEEDIFYDAPTASSFPAGYKPSNQLDYFKRSLELIKAEMKMWLNMLKR